MGLLSKLKLDSFSFLAKPFRFPWAISILALPALDGNWKCFHRQWSEEGVLKHSHHHGGHSTLAIQIKHHSFWQLLHKLSVEGKLWKYFAFRFFYMFKFMIMPNILLTSSFSLRWHFTFSLEYSTLKQGSHSPVLRNRTEVNVKSCKWVVF